MAVKSKSNHVLERKTPFRAWSRRRELLLLTLVLACQPSSRPAVRVATEAAAEAVSQGDARRLATLVVRDDGRPCSEEELVELIRRSGPELRTRLRQAALAVDRYQTTLEFELADGAAVTILEQSGSVSMHSVPYVEACPANVVGALRLFAVHVNAMSLKVYGKNGSPVFLSQNAREQWILDAKTWTDGLVAPAELDVEEIGKLAIVKLPTGRIVELTFERGCWRIEKLQ